MTRHSVTCETWDVVVVPFPFTDSPASKRRPALVLSSRAFNHGSGHSLMAQITKAKQSSWPGDFTIQNEEAGLPEECIVRMKLFTIDNRLIQRRTGRLSAADREQVDNSLRQLMPMPDKD
jgi:mRNA interferase MazF